MNPCWKARIHTALARAGAALVTGGLAWYLALPVALHFHYQLGDGLRLVIGLVFALIALAISTKALDFTEDCMSVPDEYAHAKAAGLISCNKKSCRLRS